MLFDYIRYALKWSYKMENGKPYKRKDSSVKAIVIHGTGGTVDTAKNELDYFATGNKRYAGAHAFVDYKGKAGCSIPRNRVAWSVGDKNGQGRYYGKYNNMNTISIELCAIEKKEISKAQLATLKKLIRYYGKKCPNIDNIVRHYDITTKLCPTFYTGSNKKDAIWQHLRSELMAELKKVKK